MSIRCPRGGWRLAAVIAAAGWLACSDKTLPPPTLTSIEPASAFEARAVDVTIRGERLFRTADRRLGAGARIDASFLATLSGVPLTEVRWTNSKELFARVPDTLPPGTHSLRVEAPNGAAELPNAFVVIPIERCANGSDDDGDGLADCADPECATLACEDGDPCTDTDACTGGSCSGSPKACTPPSACFSGGCEAGTCRFSVLVGNSCTDSGPCTTGGTCATDGGCVGTSTCVAPGECLSAQCGSDGGCLLTVNSGQPCTTGGTCGADGGCVAPPSGWTYLPSNFDPGALTPPTTAGTVATGCHALFSTTTETFVINCGLLPRIQRVTLSDNREATVLAFTALTIDANASLTLIGQRPAIIAVYGNATIHGQVLANSTATSVGAGGTTHPAPAGPCDGHAGFDSNSRRAGGGGAGYRDPGGKGGDLTVDARGGAGGTKIPTPAPAPLHGGCP
ncbi:MAG TPA: hypothetical protein VE618_01065, partial [Myxococcaceae bacterium]|nr:hypothetical protein [Myxococcaceae bacterium]